METKMCSRCKKELAVTEFASNVRSKDSLQGACKFCHSQYYIKYKLKHGPAFVVWKSMLQRCRDKNSKDYKYYGGRGIKVCKEWFDVKTFANWCYKNKYKKGLEIDRINNDGDYEPNNCRFISSAENCSTRSTTILKKEQVVEIKKLLKTDMMLKDIAKQFGVHRATIGSIKSGQSWARI